VLHLSLILPACDMYEFSISISQIRPQQRPQLMAEVKLASPSSGPQGSYHMTMLAFSLVFFCFTFFFYIFFIFSAVVESESRTLWILVGILTVISNPDIHMSFIYIYIYFFFFSQIFFCSLYSWPWHS
jgi:hypothetical protein